jgi:secondary thiamine-phosphate synthase enzyme
MLPALKDDQALGPRAPSRHGSPLPGCRGKIHFQTEFGYNLRHCQGSDRMKIHNDFMTVQTKKSRECMNITPNVKFAMEKSGIRDGIILVNTLHTNCAVFVNDEEPGLLEDVDEWLEKLAPRREDYKHGSKFESNASAHLQGLLAHHQVVVPISDGRLELGPWQQVIYAELDGQRPKRILIKVLGE